MQFTKKTSSGKLTSIGKFLIKVILVVFVLFLGVILISKIDFPAPNKKIEIFSSDTLKKNVSTNTLLKKVEKKKIEQQISSASGEA